MGVGLNLYDVMSVDRGRPALAPRAALRGERERGAAARRGVESWSPERHRVITGEEVLELLPALAAREPTSGYLFYDCQTDDVRLVLTVLGEAERFGAICANRVEVTACSSSDGARARACGCSTARAARAFEVRAANVVNATGVWADQLRPQELHEEAELPRIRPSRGTHITAAHTPTCRCVAGRSCRPAAGRSIFALPWLGHTLVGTTDNDYEGQLEHVAPSQPPTSTTCSRRSTTSSAPTLGPGDLTGAFAGRAALISTGDPKKSVDISRKAELYETSSGMITITGGKLTTWRRMAKMAVDRLVERDARDAPCRTHEIPLGQADPGRAAAARRGRPRGGLRGARGPLRLRRPRGARAAADAWRAGPADPPRAARPAGRGRRSRPAASRPLSIGDVLFGARGWPAGGTRAAPGEDGGSPAVARRTPATCSHASSDGTSRGSSWSWSASARRLAPRASCRPAGPGRAAGREPTSRPAL